MTHAVVWLNAQEARVIRFDGRHTETEAVAAHSPARHVRHRSGNNHSDTRVRDNREYFEAILAELEDVDEWLIVGPGDAKKDFQKYVEGHAEALRDKLIGIGPMGHATDDEIRDHARKAFVSIARALTDGPRIERAISH
jgi:stalled ribosome rescue protein Dom34